MIQRAVAATLVAFAIFAMSGGSGGCGPTPCTPDENGLGEATLLTRRDLPGRPSVAGHCTRPRVEVIASDSELRRFYDELAAAPDGGAPTAIEYPSVDFTRERVIVREGSGTEGVSWAVAQGETGVLGLLSCGGLQAASCVVNVIAVPALITRAETRTCDPVGCGPPQRAPTPNSH